MDLGQFEEGVFVNCPFDRAFEPILQAMLFCIVYLGKAPRIARERDNAAEVRLDKIVELIEASRYSIHDLSRARAQRVGEYYRMNMPFELGIDHACRRFRDQPWSEKKMLILSDRPFSYQKALSDIAGSDINTHGNRYDRAIKTVRNWLVNEANTPNVGAKLIIDKYADFQEWYFEMHRAAGAADADIKKYPTKEFLNGMIQWKKIGEPPSL